MKDIAAQAIREYIEQQVRADWLGQVTDEQLVRYRGALNRSGSKRLTLPARVRRGGGGGATSGGELSGLVPGRRRAPGWHRASLTGGPRSSG